MSTSTFALRRALQMIEMLQLLVASFNPRAVVTGSAFSFKGFAGSVIYDHDSVEFYVFDRKKVMLYGPTAIGEAARMVDPRAHQVMQTLLDEMICEQGLQVAKKLGSGGGSR